MYHKLYFLKRYFSSLTEVFLKKKWENLEKNYGKNAKILHHTNCLTSHKIYQ